MMKNTVYNYHDSLLDKVILKDNNFTFYIDLYPIYYPKDTKIKLSFKVKDSLNICKRWMETLTRRLGVKGGHVSARLDGIEILRADAHRQIYTCSVACDHMETLIFECSGVKEFIMTKNILINDTIHSVLNEILVRKIPSESIEKVAVLREGESGYCEILFDPKIRKIVIKYYCIENIYIAMLKVNQVREIVEEQIDSVIGIREDYYQS